MALSHWLESEPRAGLPGWASKTSLFMTQVNYCTKACFNGWENIFFTHSSEITHFYFVAVRTLGKKIYILLLHLHFDPL